MENFDNIRKVWKKVKGIFVDIGFDSCKELLKDFKGFDLGEKYFYNILWGDVFFWEFFGKRVRYWIKLYCCGFCKYFIKVFILFKNYLYCYYEDEID